MDFEQVVSRWADHPFFAPDTVVLGLDIGIEGIGITVRKGREWLYSRTLIVDLPEAKALAGRRQLRAARHARKNRRTRMSRLKKLFLTHGLPWVSDDVASRSDPFILRWRAIHGKLASREALSLCIRSCVMLRGFDYFAMSMEKGEYPWGESDKLTDARKWLASQFLDQTTADYLRGMLPELQGRKEELSDEEVQEWQRDIATRLQKGKEEGIEKMLRDYKNGKLNTRRARGFNFPRSHVETHLRTILERHKDLIDDYEGFVQAFFLPCDTRANKRKAIFHFNRKTPDEAKEHYEKKVKDCPFATSDILKTVGGAKCGLRGDPVIRRWNLVNFLSNHRFNLQSGKLPAERQLLPVQGVRALVDHIMNGSKPSWKEAKKAMETAIKPMKFVLKDDWNAAQITHLKDIVAPPVKVRKGRANFSPEAARELYALATNDGQNLEPLAIEAWKKESGYYDELKRIDNGGLGLYPQVQTLLGTLRKPNRVARAKNGGKFATEGLLQRIFTKEIADKLDGKTVPDYCIIECIKDPARNKDQKAEIEKKQKENRDRREKLITTFGLDKEESGLSHAAALRLRLFTEQGGTKTTPALCPFTGEELGTDPMTSDLQLAHLFPDARGGLYMAENLVLTTKEVNDEMRKRTPKEAAAAHPSARWLSWEEMLKKSQKFHWGKMKRSLFAFPDEDAVSKTFPEFNNMTRTAQLARELRRLTAVWMGIENDPEAMRQRIGNVSGVYTAAARKALPGDDFVKNRMDNNHHRKDAAVMTCIPPAEGLNDARYGGVFYREEYCAQEREQKAKVYSTFYMVDPSSLPLPDFAELSKLEETQSPVFKLQSRSKSRSLGDGTFWRVEADSSTSQRTAVDPSKMKASDIHGALVKATEFAKAKNEQLSLHLIPSEKAIEKWLTDCQPATKNEVPDFKPLCLTNGVPVKSIRKYNGKGSFTSPLGWSAAVQQGRIFQARRLVSSNDRLEIWLGWNAKKKKWEYFRRLIPTKSTLNGLKRMGLPWRGTKDAPQFLLELLRKEKAKDLCSLICGVLPPHAVKVGILRKGMMFRLNFREDKKAVQKLREKNPRLNAEDFPPEVESWGSISAIKSDFGIEIKCVERKDRMAETAKAADKSASLLGLPSPEEKAKQLNLQPPA